jgi:hypothetical protein
MEVMDVFPFALGRSKGRPFGDAVATQKGQGLNKRSPDAIGGQN